MINQKEENKMRDKKVFGQNKSKVIIRELFARCLCFFSCLFYCCCFVLLLWSVECRRSNMVKLSEHWIVFILNIQKVLRIWMQKATKSDEFGCVKLKNCFGSRRFFSLIFSLFLYTPSTKNLDQTMEIA